MIIKTFNELKFKFKDYLILFCTIIGTIAVLIAILQAFPPDGDDIIIEDIAHYGVIRDYINDTDYLILDVFFFNSGNKPGSVNLSGIKFNQNNLKTTHEIPEFRYYGYVDFVSSVDLLYRMKSASSVQVRQQQVKSGYFIFQPVNSLNPNDKNYSFKFSSDDILSGTLCYIQLSNSKEKCEDIPVINMPNEIDTLSSEKNEYDNFYTYIDL